MKNLNKKVNDIFNTEDRQKWESVKFSDFAENINIKVKPAPEDSLKYIGLEHLDAGSIRIRRWGTAITLKGEKIRMEKGDVIFGKRNAYLRRASISPFDGICSAHAMVLRNKPNMMDTDFFPFFLNSDYFMDRANMISVGSLSPTINWSTLAKEVFKIPPLEVQKKFTKILSAVDLVEERYRTAIEVLHKAREVTFLDLSKKYAEENKLGKCLILSKKKSGPPHTLDRYIGLEHIEPGSFKTNLYADAKLVKSSCGVFKSGQLLYSKLRPNLDKAIIADFNGVCTTELLVYDAAPGISLEYILHYLHSDGFIHYATTRGFGTKMPRISHKILSEYKVFIPSIDNQKIVLDELSKFTVLNAQLFNSLKEIQELRKITLNQMLI